MRVLLQMAVIFGLWMLGEAVSRGLGIPVPGSIIGMVLLFVLLCTKVIKLEWIEQASGFLLDNMGILFVPIGVGLLTMTEILSGNIVALAVIIPAGAITVMVVSGLVVQWLSRRQHD